VQTCLISRPQQVLSSIGGSARPSSCFCRGLVHCCNSPTGRAVVGSCLQDCTVLGGFERVPFNALPLQSLQLLASCWFGLSAISRADMTPGALLCCLQKLQQQYVNPFVGCLQAFLGSDGSAAMARFRGPVTPHCTTVAGKRRSLLIFRRRGSHLASLGMGDRRGLWCPVHPPHVGHGVPRLSFWWSYTYIRAVLNSRYAAARYLHQKPTTTATLVALRPACNMRTVVVAMNGSTAMVWTVDVPARHPPDSQVAWGSPRARAVACHDSFQLN